MVRAKQQGIRAYIGHGAIQLRARIFRDPQICGGEPVFKGTRVTLRTVLGSLADGDTVAEVLADFPSLKLEDVQAAIAFAAASQQKKIFLSQLPLRFDENQARRESSLASCIQAESAWS